MLRFLGLPGFISELKFPKHLVLKMLKKNTSLFLQTLGILERHFQYGWNFRCGFCANDCHLVGTHL